MEKKTEVERIECLEKLSIDNFDQHQLILAEIKKLSESITPISDTYNTVGRLAKWLMAFLVFLSVLGGVLVAWGNVFKK